jgi:hypothetical protein
MVNLFIKCFVFSKMAIVKYQLKCFVHITQKMVNPKTPPNPFRKISYQVKYRNGKIP